MILQRLISRVGRTVQIKQFNCGIAVRNVKPVIEGSESSVKSSTSANPVSKAPKFTISKLDKRILVWVKRYPNIESVPDRVREEVLQAARSRFRIRLCNILIVLILVGFFCAAMSGKKARREGQSLSKMSREWYEKQKEEYVRNESPRNK